MLRLLPLFVILFFFLTWIIYVIVGLKGYSEKEDFKRGIELRHKILIYFKMRFCNFILTVCRLIQWQWKTRGEKFIKIYIRIRVSARYMHSLLLNKKQKRKEGVTRESLLRRKFSRNTNTSPGICANSSTNWIYSTPWELWVSMAETFVVGVIFSRVFYAIVMCNKTGCSTNQTAYSYRQKFSTNFRKFQSHWF